MEGESKPFWRKIFDWKAPAVESDSEKETAAIHTANKELRGFKSLAEGEEEKEEKKEVA